jgi:recombination protein RecR
MEDSLQQLTALVSRLPGLGPRSARRVVLHLMKHRETALQPLVAALGRVDAALSACNTCGNLDTANPCRICTDPKRNPDMLCVVADVADLWALERGRLFPGRYHVLGGTLSALDGIGPDDLSVGALVARVSGTPPIGEVVLAMNATLEGQTTAHYLAEQLAGTGTRLTQLAHGMPVGGELDYLDEGTLAQALRLRRPVG